MLVLMTCFCLTARACNQSKQDRGKNKVHLADYIDTNADARNDNAKGLMMKSWGCSWAGVDVQVNPCADQGEREQSTKSTGTRIL